MTIKLLTDWPYKRANGAGYVTMPAGAVVGVFDAATEAGMIAAKVALASAEPANWTPPSDAGFYDQLQPAEISSVRSLVSGAVIGLVPDTTSARAANRALIQAALDQAAANGGGQVSITIPGKYHVGGYAPASWADFPALFSVPSNTEVYIGEGVELISPQSITGDSNPNCCIFANQNILSNPVSVVVANTAVVAGTELQRYTRVTFETSTAHGYSVGDYALLKGDTSNYQWDGVYRVYAVPDSTHFTVEVYYRQANERPLTNILPTGTVITHKADNNIRITVDGVLNMMQNTNDAFSGSLGRFAIALNKFGTAEVKANFDGCIVGVGACNFDRLYVHPTTMINGAVPVWPAGPFRDLVVEEIYAQGTEELVYLYTKEPGRDVFRNANNTGNDGGSIRSVKIGKLIGAQNSIRRLLVGVGDGHTIGSVTVDEIHCYAGTLGVEIATPPATTGNIGDIRFGKIIHDPDPNPTTPIYTILLNNNDTGTLNIGKLDYCVQTYNRPYVNGGSLSIRNSTSGSGTIGKLVIRDLDIVGDINASTATRAGANVGPGAGYTIGDIDIINPRIRAVGTTRTLHGIDVAGSLAAVGAVNLTGGLHDSPTGTLLAVGKNTRVKVSQSRGLGATASGLVNLSDSCTVELVQCTGATGQALVNCTGSGRTWNIKVSLCDTPDFLCRGYSGASGNTINIWSGGGNSTLGGRIAPDNRAGTTINFRGNCADMQFDVASAQCGRVDGSIVYNTNAAAGTLGVAGLVVGQGTAANSWKLMSDPTKSY